LYSHHFDKLDKPQEVAMIAQYMTIVLVVFLPTLGGAMRFLSEKLAIEAEALSYRDAHVWFEHSKDLLCEQRPGRGDHKADQRAKDVISGSLTLRFLKMKPDSNCGGSSRCRRLSDRHKAQSSLFCRCALATRRGLIDTARST
jgi:hypothetical protein